jgi:glycosyltransferase involved in cell wall biosynthesis
VCIPVRNEERFIHRTIDEIQAQDYPQDRYEIIVADGESTDKTAEIVKSICRKHPNVLLFNNPQRRSSAGRNIGFKNGKGDLFLVVDGHCLIGNPQLFRKIVNCFKKSGAQCLGRPQPLDPPGINDFQKALALARESSLGHGGDSLIYSSHEGFVSPVSHGAVYKREVFEKVGYVDEAFDVCEDVDFNYRVERAGFKTYMSPSIAIKYFPRENISSLWRQMLRYGKGRFQFLQKHPETFSIMGMVPAIFVAGLFLLPIFGLIHSAFFSLWVAACGLYLLVVAAASLKIAFRAGLPFLPYLPVIYFVIHVGLGLGFILKFINFIFKND